MSSASQKKNGVDDADRSRLERLPPAFLPSLAFVLVFLMTAFAVSYVGRLEERSREAAFESASRERTAAVRRGFEDGQAIVEFIGSFFDASTEVRDEDFDVFARSLLQRNRNLSAVSWVPRVQAQDRGRHEAEAQARYPGYGVTERQRQGEMVRRGPASEFFPVRYIVPLETNEVALGFDLGSDERRLAAVLEAGQRRQVVATAPLLLVQEQGAGKGIGMHRPLYRAPGIAVAGEPSPGDFIGVVSAIFRADDVVHEAMEGLEPMGIDFHLLDVTEPSDPMEIARYGSWTGGEIRPETSREESLRATGEFEIAGRQYRLGFRAAPGSFNSTISLSALGLLTSGTLLALSIAALLFIIQRSHSRARSYASVLQRLSQKLLMVQESERHHLARELHDQLGQDLTALRVNMHVVASSKDPEKQARAFTESNLILDRILEQVQTISLDLRPTALDDLGLQPALQTYLSREAERSGLKLDYRTSASIGRLPEEVETAVFRFTQEAVVNVVRHAGASKIQVALEKSDGNLEVSISDDGAGFDPGAERDRTGRFTSCGLLGMQERITLVRGKMQIDSRRGGGTRVKAWIPVETS